jgi:serine/threonine protein kinase
MSQDNPLFDRLRKALLPDYTLERELAAGGMGHVFLGRDVRLNRAVAIKVLRPALATSEFVERFDREVRALAQLSHPNIVSIYRVDEKEGLFFYIMEYLGDQTLAARLAQGPLSRPEVIALGLDLLSGLEAAHGKQLIHRAIKPSNIFLVHGRARIADFGIVQPSGETATITEPGLAIGSPGYVAPEQSVGAAVTEQTDLYAVGVVLYEAATGRKWPPLQRPEDADWRGVSRRLASVLSRALQIEAGRRWTSASEFRAELRATADSPISAGVGVAILSTGAVVALLAWLLWPPRNVPAVGTSDLAILPVRMQGMSAPIDSLELARRIHLDLEWFGRLRLAPLRYVFNWSGRAPVATRDELAPAGLNAAHVVAGVMMSQGSEPVLEVRIYERGGSVSHRFTVQARAANLAVWSQMVADSIVLKVFPEQWHAYSPLRRHLVANRLVYKHYFAGEDLFQRDAYNLAERQYDSALVADSTFVPAIWRLAIVHRFQRVPFEDDLRELFRRYPGELSEQNRALIQALLEPNLARRFEVYRQTVSRYPADGFASFVYADELFHRGPLAGFALDSAVAQFARTVAVEPYLDQMPAYDHLLYGYLRLGERDSAKAVLQYRVRIRPPGEEEDFRRRRFFRLAYDERFRPWLGRLERFWLRMRLDAPTLEAIGRFARLGYTFDIPETQIYLGRILAAKATTTRTRANGHRAQGLALMELGRPMAALPQLDSASVMFGEADSLLERAEWRIMPGVLGMPGVSEFERSWGKATLGTLAKRRDAIGARARFALATEALERHDGAEAGRWAARLDDSTARGLGVLVRSLAAGERNRPDSALALSEPLLSYQGRGGQVDPFARSVLYLHRVEWFLARHDSTAADRTRVWYQNSDYGLEGWPQGEIEPGEVDAMLSIYARLLQAEADLTRGRNGSACLLVARVRELWQNVESGIRPLLERADRVAARCP